MTVFYVISNIIICFKGSNSMSYFFSKPPENSVAACASFYYVFVKDSKLFMLVIPLGKLLVSKMNGTVLVRFKGTNYQSSSK